MRFIVWSINNVCATKLEFTPMLRYKHLMNTAAAPLIRTAVAPLIRTAAAPLIRTAAAPLIRTAVAVGFAIMLSGCVVYPAWGPYYHPHHWGY